MTAKNKKSGRGTTLLLIVLFLIGLSLLLYPTFSNYWNSMHQTKAIASYSEAVAGISDEEYQAYWNAARAYNEDLRRRSNAYETTDELLARYESLLNIAGNGVMGYIDIPSIEVRLPIYHGTSNAILQVAVGHLDWTSLPTGGESTHAVLSGHRGLPSAKLFTDLDKLVEGDIFLLRVLNEVMTYEVDQILIVEPKDVTSLGIVEGEDLCTLVTCTPYGINTHRMLVRGHRIENAKEAASITITSEMIQIDELLVAATLAAPILLLLILMVFLKGSGHAIASKFKALRAFIRRKKNKQPEEPDKPDKEMSAAEKVLEAQEAAENKKRKKRDRKQKKEAKENEQAEDGEASEPSKPAKPKRSLFRRKAKTEQAQPAEAPQAQSAPAETSSAPQEKEMTAAQKVLAAYAAAESKKQKKSQAADVKPADSGKPAKRSLFAKKEAPAQEQPAESQPTEAQPAPQEQVSAQAAFEKSVLDQVAREKAALSGEQPKPAEPAVSGEPAPSKPKRSLFRRKEQLAQELPAEKADAPKDGEMTMAQKILAAQAALESKKRKKAKAASGETNGDSEPSKSSLLRKKENAKAQPAEGQSEENRPEEKADSSMNRGMSAAQRILAAQAAIESRKKAKKLADDETTDPTDDGDDDDLYPTEPSKPARPFFRKKAQPAQAQSAENQPAEKTDSPKDTGMTAAQRVLAAYAAAEKAKAQKIQLADDETTDPTDDGDDDDLYPTKPSKPARSLFRKKERPAQAQPAESQPAESPNPPKEHDMTTAEKIRAAVEQNGKPADLPSQDDGPMTAERMLAERAAAIMQRRKTPKDRLAAFVRNSGEQMADAVKSARSSVGKKNETSANSKHDLKQ